MYQALDDEGGVVTSAYLWPEQPLPEQATRSLERVLRSSSFVLTASGLLTAGTASVLYASRGVGTDRSQADFYDETLVPLWRVGGGLTALGATGLGVSLAL